MDADFRTTDTKAGAVLPKPFANATVVIDQVCETEPRVSQSKVVPEVELPFREELSPLLSERDRDLFMDLLENPPAPTPALREAAVRQRARRA